MNVDDDRRNIQQWEYKNLKLHDIVEIRTVHNTAHRKVSGSKGKGGKRKIFSFCSYRLPHA